MPYTELDATALDVVSYILDIRYTNSLREDEGGTYGASTAAQINRRLGAGAHPGQFRLPPFRV